MIIVTNRSVSRSAPVLLAIELAQLFWHCRFRFLNVRDGPLHLLIALPLELVSSGSRLILDGIFMGFQGFSIISHHFSIF